MATQKPRNTFHGSDDEKRVSALVIMNYITMSICNAYAEEVKDILEQYGAYSYDTKHESEMAIRAFDRYHDAMKKFFKGELLAQRQMIEVYEMVKKVLDEQVLESLAQYKRKQEQS